MASVAPPSDRILTSSANALEAAELLQKFALDSPKKPLQTEPVKKNSVGYSPVDAVGNVLNNPMERSVSPFMDHGLFYNPNGSSFMDPNMLYNPSGYPPPTYYYGGNEWDQYNSDGVEIQNGLYGDYQQNFSYMPYGYSPSGSTMGHDGQMYGAQQYQYPTSYFQPPNTIPNLSTSQAEATHSFGTNQSQLPIDSSKGNQFNAGHVMTNQTNVQKPIIPNNLNSVKNNEFYRSGGVPTGSGILSSAALQGTHANRGRNQNQRPLPHLMGLQHPRATSGVGHSGYVNQIYPNNRAYGQYTSAYRSGAGAMSSSYYPRITGNGLFSVGNKYKSRSRIGYGYNKESTDGLNELNKGPRSKGLKDQYESKPITLAVKGQSLSLRESNVVDKLPLFPDKEQYNKEDFPETYSDAKFFVIKSYSEDDVHKSIKYGIWTSTPNGNKKLDAAYKEAKQKSEESPVFLLFSVNGSGQFAGLAEMVGPVDFDRTVEYWQQDKWSGCFPVKWHLIKDLPNSCLRHITLQNNENKPVTNSRDTQEVRFDQGLEILKIYKSHISQTCILDDFNFYEGRQKVMQEKKSRQRQTNIQQVGALKLFGSVSTENGEREIPKKSNDLDLKSTDTTVAPGSKVNGEVKLPGENLSILTKKDTSNASRLDVKENNFIPNGINKIT